MGCRVGEYAFRIGSLLTYFTSLMDGKEGSPLSTPDLTLLPLGHHLVAELTIAKSLGFFDLLQTGKSKGIKN